jgi:hypothetical protein
VELSNRDLVGRGFELLAEGLQPFVERHMAGVAPGGMDWFVWLSGRRENRGITLSRTDPLVLLRVITRHDEVFKDTLSRAERSYAQELWDCRNNWAHNSLFNEADTRRLLDTIQRLLQAAGAVVEAEQVQRVLRDYKRPAPRMPTHHGPQESDGREASHTAGTTPGSEPDQNLPRSERPEGGFLRQGRRNRPIATVTAVAVALGATGAAIYALTHVGHPGKSSLGRVGVTSPFIHIKNPPPSGPGNIPAQVACSQEVSGTAQIPGNDVIVVAYRKANGADWWYFRPTGIHWQGNAWNVTVYFGTPEDVDKLFRVSVFAMPRSWESYLDSLYASINAKAGGGWVYHDLPPSAVALTTEIVNGLPSQAVHKQEAPG